MFADRRIEQPVLLAELGLAPVERSERGFGLLLGVRGLLEVAPRGLERLAVVGRRAPRAQESARAVSADGQDHSEAPSATSRSDFGAGQDMERAEIGAVVVGDQRDAVRQHGPAHDEAPAGNRRHAGNDDRARMKPQRPHADEQQQQHESGSLQDTRGRVLKAY